MLVVPWGVPADAGHDTHPRQVYRRGDVHLPRSPERVGFNLDHNPGDVAGRVGVVAVADVGLWCAAKLDSRALSHISEGRTSVSAEIDDAGRLSGVALVTAEFAGPAFPSARVLTDLFLTPGFLTPPPPAPTTALQWVVREADAHGGLLILNPQRSPVLPPPVAHARGGGHGRREAELHASSVTAVHEQVEADRRRRDERLAASATAEADREELGC